MSPDFCLGSDGLLRCLPLDRLFGQTHAFGTRISSPSANVTLKQIHSDRVHRAAGLADRHVEGDALIANEPGLAIGVRTADCVPVLLFDPFGRAAAAVHAGWRGTVAGIMPNAVERLVLDYGSRPSDVYAAMGPCIGPCCYRVGSDVALQFEKWGATRSGIVDLVAANRRQLVDSGVLPENIFDSGLCTACKPELLYSYRRDPSDPGRMLSAIAVV